MLSATGHDSPINPHSPNCNGSTYNTMIEWENVEINSKPLSEIDANDPVKYSICAKECNFLDNPDWKPFKQISKCEKIYSLFKINQNLVLIVCL